MLSSVFSVEDGMCVIDTLLSCVLVGFRCLVGVGVAEVCAANVSIVCRGHSSLDGSSRLVEVEPLWVPFSDSRASIVFGV